LYFSPNVIQEMKSSRMRWTVNVVHMGGKEMAYRVLVGKLEAKRPLGKPAAQS
jgi:hypothetical protein